MDNKIGLTNKDNKLIVSWTLDHLVHFPDVLILVSDRGSLLVKETLETLPTHASVPGSVNGSILGVHQNHLIVVATPHQVVDLAIQVERLEVNSRGHIAAFLAARFVAASVCAHASLHLVGEEHAGGTEGQELLNSLHARYFFCDTLFNYKQPSERIS